MTKQKTIKDMVRTMAEFLETLYENPSAESLKPILANLRDNIYNVELSLTSEKQSHTSDDSYNQKMNNNISLRNYFAATAMTALLRQGDLHCGQDKRGVIEQYPEENWREELSIEAYRIADAMLLAQSKNKPTL